MTLDKLPLSVKCRQGCNMPLGCNVIKIVAKSKPDRTDAESKSKVKLTWSLSKSEGSKVNLKDRLTEWIVECSHGQRRHSEVILGLCGSWRCQNWWGWCLDVLRDLLLEVAMGGMKRWKHEIKLVSLICHPVTKVLLPVAHISKPWFSAITTHNNPYKTYSVP